MIRVLPKEVSDKIAAGEVIESTVSIVKELIENSIDANATVITCEIVKGGKEEIRITDNGVGIPSEDVSTAFLRHATSKIEKAEDLKSLNTLGFRGEALASISAVSRTELITKTEDEKAGTRIIIHGGNTVSKEKIGCPVGTTIIVKDLFYNMPARAKFMKSEGAETGKIADMMSRLAITRPDIKFTFISNGKTYFTSPGTGNIKASVLSVYKEREYKELLEIPVSEYKDGEIKIYGLLSKPSLTRTSRRSQFYFVNGRTIKSSLLEKAVSLGYKERLFEGRYPIVFLFLEIDPTKVDVNVHPNKKEVRFNDEIEVITAVEETVRNTILSRDAVIKGIDSLKNIDNDSNHHIKKKKVEEKAEQVDIKSFLSSLSSGEPVNSNHYFVHEEIRELERTEGIEKDKTGEIENTKETEKPNETKNIEESSFDLKTKELKPFDFDELEFGETIFGTYITATDSNNFYLFDQHAAHERINYERLVKEYLSEKKNSQVILTPLNFDVPNDLLPHEEEWIKILNDMGYLIENFGENTYVAREIPVFMSMEEAEGFIHSFIDTYKEDKKVNNQVVIDKLITKSCKMSIKAHDYIKKDEVTALIDDLKKCNNPFSCPHGRPTFIKFSKYDIEKMFKRVQ